MSFCISFLYSLGLVFFKFFNFSTLCLITSGPIVSPYKELPIAKAPTPRPPPEPPKLRGNFVIVFNFGGGPFGREGALKGFCPAKGYACLNGVPLEVTKGPEGFIGPPNG